MEGREDGTPQRQANAGEWGRRRLKTGSRRKGRFQTLWRGSRPRAGGCRRGRASSCNELEARRKSHGRAEAPLPTVRSAHLVPTTQGPPVHCGFPNHESTGNSSLFSNPFLLSRNHLFLYPATGEGQKEALYPFYASCAPVEPAPAPAYGERIPRLARSRPLGKAAAPGAFSAPRSRSRRA